MGKAKAEDQRKSPRFGMALPIHFNLNPDYHYVPSIKRFGVGGTLRDVSLEGIRIDSQMDLEDVCQIFSEAMEEGSPFELEVFFWDSRGRSAVLRGSVKWYEVSGPESDVRHFKAGLSVRGEESRSTARSMVESITGPAEVDPGGQRSDAQEMVSSIGPVEDGDEIVLEIAGNLTDGTPIEGEDTVTIIRKGK